MGGGGGASVCARVRGCVGVCECVSRRSVHTKKKSVQLPFSHHFSKKRVQLLLSSHHFSKKRVQLLLSSLMAESTLTHQIGFTRTNCAWIALNLLLNILMCYLVLQISPRPNETSMNPYYGPNTIGDLPRDFDKVLAQAEKGHNLLPVS